jgi:hypothetical protein
MTRQRKFVVEQRQASIICCAELILGDTDLAVLARAVNAYAPNLLADNPRSFADTSSALNASLEGGQR